ncbi:MAG: S-methyl-5'-thioadenosine phosphorylase [Myxococcota bacterium]|nr:S-methyl-5'-thioadenosine phosphorylase [Myxococcota bacterium]
MTELHPAPLLAIIGGSGLYDVPGLEDLEWRSVKSPWGQPSDDLLFGRIKDVPVVFLPRHGRGHRLSPSGINYRANIDVLKRSGVTDIISLSAVGSFRDEFAPGDFVICNQFIDRTSARERSFFGSGLVAHVSMAHPVNPRLGDWSEDACRELDIRVHRDGTYLAMEGPQFSTLAESNLYRQWNCDVIGMTNMPEAKLAREAEIPYCTVAMVTDYDCWHPDHDNVNVETIITTLKTNSLNANKLIAAIAPRMKERPALCPSGDDRALDGAIITEPDVRDPERVAKLDAIAGRVLGA